MVYKIVNIFIYLISIGLAMVALSCFSYEKVVKKNKIREFYILYLMVSIALGYLFASFILDFGLLTFY